MLVVPHRGNEEKPDLLLLVAAIEDAIDGTDLHAMAGDTLRDLEMRLATVCHVLGVERAEYDPMREEREEPEFGDGSLR